MPYPARVATLVLVRHGRTTANASGVLAGRLPGVSLDDHGQAQAEAVGRRFAGVSVAAAVTSPLLRCRQTSRAIWAGRADRPEVLVDARLVECDYGEWQGRRLAELARQPLWGLVQRQASAAAFPSGESLRAMSTRAVDAVREIDQGVTEQHGAGGVWVAVSHGDVIKAIVADALGLHLDLFQRITIDPASVSIIRYGTDRPDVVAVNTHEGDLGWLNPPRRRRGRQPRGTLGGGAGP